ncbi:AraC family transcriptional regulator [Leptospira sp. 201903070]|uniref:AraC family transcriptional regulator n=1 Tax=Leptospira ainlahdjerensis TaxID=2810033 RepID=A0ABS2UGI5_9LEPT|nr:GyrI-like domain-containing protein [Leptospira ainlahdjerensis]MBM9579487.1 AraC family transcriptional regulator [Leptospira ainlahdjerensis]
MSSEIVSKNEVQIVGISEVTKNQDEISGKGKIGGLWHRFFAEGILDKIPNKKEPANLFAVYTDYESDESGKYRILIGAEVTDGSWVPEGMELRKIPKGKYSKFTSDTGSIATVVIAVWRKIWSDSELKSKRAFQSDFEFYDQRTSNPESAQVEVFIGMK